MNGPAGMGMNPATGGPVGAPQMNQAQPQAGQYNQSQLNEMQFRLNTYIYDHLILTKQYDIARAFQRTHTVKTKSSPAGVPPIEQPKENAKRPDDLEDAEIPPHLGEHSFLMDWFCMFWDTYRAAKQQPTYRPVALEYMAQQRMRSNDQLKMRMGMNMNPNAMNMNGMNGMKPGQRPPPQLQAEMQRRMQMGQPGQGMEGQQPRTPGSMDNAPSPSKKPRLDNGEFAQGMPGQGGRPMGNPMMANGMDPQMAAFAGQNGQPRMEGMNGLPAQLGAKMPEGDLDAMQRQGMAAGTQAGGDGRHALQDYQLQLMLLEQQNKKRLLQARREQDTISTNMQGQPGVGPGPGGMINNGAFAPNMSPQGSRGGGPSPNPSDGMKRGTPKLAQPGLPGSPMGDMQRNSPGAPGFDPSNGQMPGGMPANYYQQNMRQPQTSHPNMQQMAMPGMNAQQFDQMNRMNNINNGRMMNGQNAPGAPGMPFNPQGSAAAGGPQQRPGNMAPPPAPAEGPGAQAAQSSPAQPAAPPTPSQTNKAAPKKKETAAQKKKNAPKKGAATAATPTESADAPASTPATPMTPSVRDTFPKSVAPAATTTQALAPPAAQPILDNSNAMFGNLDQAGEFEVNLDFAGAGSGDVLNDFDFDSFLTNNDDMSNMDQFNFDGEMSAGNG